MASAYGETGPESVLTLCSEQCRVVPYQFEHTLNKPRTVTFDTDLTSSSDEDSSMRESSRTVSDIDSTQPGCELVIPPVEFGSHGVYCEVTVGDKNIMDFYFKLGFLEIALQGNVSDDEIYLGRIF